MSIDRNISHSIETRISKGFDNVELISTIKFGVISEVYNGESIDEKELDLIARRNMINALNKGIDDALFRLCEKINVMSGGKYYYDILAAIDEFRDEIKFK